MAFNGRMCDVDHLSSGQQQFNCHDHLCTLRTSTLKGPKKHIYFYEFPWHYGQVGTHKAYHGVNDFSQSSFLKIEKINKKYKL